MSNGWLKILTPLFFVGSMPCFVSAAKSSNWFPQHHTPTVLLRIAAIELMPLDFHAISSIPDFENICAMLTSFVPVSRAARRLGSQSTPICAWPLATTCSGVMLGPPTLSFTFRPKSL